MAHAGGAPPAAKRLRRAPALGFEVYGPDNPNQPAFIDFSLLSESTIRRYLEKYDVPVKSGMTLAELRVQASRHFTLAPISDLANPKGSAAAGANGSSSSSGSSSSNKSTSAANSNSNDKHSGSGTTKSKSKSSANGATVSNAIDRFHGFLVKLKMRAKNVKRREKEHANQLLNTPLVPAAIAATVGQESAGSSNVSDLAAVPTGLTNRDPSEGYCVLSCKFSGSSKSGGTMIACDGKDHPEQWYHLSCVGLDDEPNGQWFCFACTHAKMQEEEAEKQRSAADASANSGLKSGKKLQTFVKYIKAALKALGSKKGRSAEGTAKQITAVIERKFGDKLEISPESDSRKTPVWKAFVAKTLRSTKAPFQKAKKNGQWVYSLVTNSKSSTSNSSVNNSGSSGSGNSK
eukprot:INCI9298.1.p1 GENE.INCI9298.1~~INCI9298.1.p1  ORF type:complete len:404 (-),score=74.10 INCI9298.1:272-1483(-)